MKNIEEIKLMLSDLFSGMNEPMNKFLELFAGPKTQSRVEDFIKYSPMYITDYKLGVYVVEYPQTTELPAYREVIFKNGVSDIAKENHIKIGERVSFRRELHRVMFVEGDLIKYQNLLHAYFIDENGNFTFETDGVNCSVVFDIINGKMWSETDFSIEESLDYRRVYRRDNKGERGRVGLDDNWFNISEESYVNNLALLNALEDTGILYALKKAERNEHSAPFLTLYAYMVRPEVSFVLNHPIMREGILNEFDTSFIGLPAIPAIIDNILQKGDCACTVLGLNPKWEELYVFGHSKSIEQLKSIHRTMNSLFELTGVDSISRLRILGRWAFDKGQDLGEKQLERLVRLGIDIDKAMDYLFEQQEEFGLYIVNGISLYYSYVLAHRYVYGETPKKNPEVLRVGYDRLEYKLRKLVFEQVETEDDYQILERMINPFGDLGGVVDEVNTWPAKAREVSPKEIKVIFGSFVDGGRETTVARAKSEHEDDLKNGYIMLTSVGTCLLYSHRVNTQVNSSDVANNLCEKFELHNYALDDGTDVPF